MVSGARNCGGPADGRGEDHGGIWRVQAHGQHQRDAARARGGEQPTLGHACGPAQALQKVQTCNSHRTVQLHNSPTVQLPKNSSTVQLS
jgi:hypothetical protein